MIQSEQAVWGCITYDGIFLWSSLAMRQAGSLVPVGYKSQLGMHGGGAAAASLRYLPCCARMMASSCGSIWLSSMPGGREVTPQEGPAGAALESEAARRSRGKSATGHGPPASRMPRAKGSRACSYDTCEARGHASQAPPHPHTPSAASPPRSARTLRRRLLEPLAVPLRTQDAGRVQLTPLPRVSHIAQPVPTVPVCVLRGSGGVLLHGTGRRGRCSTAVVRLTGLA